MFFGVVKPPRSGPSETALRLRSLPEGGPPLGENFSKLLVKINDFLMEIVIVLIRVVFFDWLNSNVNHQSCFEKLSPGIKKLTIEKK